MTNRDRTTIELHPVNQPISGIAWSDVDGDFGHAVGRDGVTQIEATFKPGEYSNIPYVRVWRGESCVCEMNQHKLTGLWFVPVAS